MSDSLPVPAPSTGVVARGKPPLRAGTHADHAADMLRRALHTVECRELGPDRAEQLFGLLADKADGRVSVAVDAGGLLARHPGHEELHRLVRAVGERGPAVDVFLVRLKPVVGIMDEMAHVLGRAAEQASGLTLLAGQARWR
ncbi:hypothetical protein [Streptomyces clavuligerus]|uniref:hypothetical protein n=1 Tax=Streptomyces clavuligerus TaxID=1901 RepID=UPI00020D9192|nr:hypothetical protein [Streptomyces clavuligerus]WDN55893.1 hypothetical protein LL058_28765 [Streptomyces clavuligerus]